MTDVTDQSFQQDVVERSRSVPVIVDFWAEWCGPCLQLGPVLEAAVADAGDEVELVKVDIDANPKTAVSYGVQSIPAVKAFKDGRVVDEFVGAVPRSSVDLFLRGLLPSEADRLVELGDIESRLQARELGPDHPAARGALAPLEAAASEIAHLDSIFARARFARKFDCVAPLFSSGNSLRLEAARNAKIDQVKIPTRLTHDIARLEITKNHWRLLRMQVAQHITKMQSYRKRLVQRETTPTG